MECIKNDTQGCVAGALRGGVTPSSSKNSKRRAMNKLRQLINPTEEERERQRRVVERMCEEMARERKCCTCKNTVKRDHYEMGKKAGLDTYCTIDGELKLGEGCLFYEREMV